MFDFHTRCQSMTFRSSLGLTSFCFVNLQVRVHQTQTFVLSERQIFFIHMNVSEWHTKPSLNALYGPSSRHTQACLSYLSYKSLVFLSHNALLRACIIIAKGIIMICDRAFTLIEPFRETHL